MVALDEKQLEFWRQNSYVVIPALFRDQIEQIQQWSDEVASWPRNDSKWLTNHEKDKPTQLSRRENIVPYHTGIAGILNGEDTLTLISQVMGERALLYKDRINFKYPGGGAHLAHQDSVAFDKTQQPHVTMMVSIDPTTRENGCLELVNGWHYQDREVLRQITLTDGMITKIHPGVEAELDWRPMITMPGDVLLFNSFIPHRSAVNASNVSRRVLYSVYNSASEGDLRTAYFDKKRLNQNDPKYFVGNPHALVEPEKVE